MDSIPTIAEMARRERLEAYAPDLYAALALLVKTTGAGQWLTAQRDGHHWLTYDDLLALVRGETA
jgi:hypothetical protein